MVPLKIYFDAEIKKYQVMSDKSHWSMSSTQSVKNAINIEQAMLKDGKIQLKKFKSDERQTLPNGYWLELEQND